MGHSRYPEAKNLMITADSGGSNGYRRRLWKAQLQKFADSAGLAVHVTHLPPGTSKWNKIEHRLFSFISQNWRGRPLISHEVIVNLIASTRTGKGLKVYCQLDSNPYFAPPRASIRVFFGTSSGGSGTDPSNAWTHLREDCGMNIKGNEIGELYLGERSEEKSLVVSHANEDR